MFWQKKWGILIKRESESLDFTGLEIPRDYKLTTGGVYVESYHLNGMKVGAISAYKNNKFILQDYKHPTDASTFHFFIGSFSGASFITDKAFQIANPVYTGSGVFQDIHYSSVFGLFATTRVSGTDYIVRVSAEKIDSVMDKAQVAPDELYLVDDGIAEIESLYLSDDGILYYTDNTQNDKEFSKILTLNCFTQ